jgi:hypothetical protein
MRKYHDNRTHPESNDHDGPAEGVTTRLSSDSGVAAMHQRWQHFPWPLLWLIWPAILLVKWLAPTALAAFQTLNTMLFTLVQSGALLSIGLIVVGVWLLRRRG